MDETDKHEKAKRAQNELENRIEETEKWLSDDGADVGDNLTAATRDLSVYSYEQDGRQGFARKYGVGKTPTYIRSVRFLPETARGKNIHSGHRQRMRGSARRDKQLAAMSDVELIEYALSFVIPHKDTNPLAHMLLDKYGSVIGVLRAPTQELICFPNMTADAATVLPVLTYMSMWDGCREIVLNNPSDAADFFGSVFLGGEDEGTFAAFLDGGYRLIAVEKYAGKTPIASAVIGSAGKYAARYVIFARREREIYPDESELNARIDELIGALDAIKVKLIDVMIFTDYGYYTVASPNKEGDWYAKYIFIPTRAYSRAVELAIAFGSGKGRR